MSTIFNIVPNVVKPNATYLPNTLTPFQCNIVLGINDVGYGTTGETGFYNGSTPPTGGWTIYYSDGSGNIYTQVANSFNDLLEITNYLYGTAGHFTDANAIVYYYGDVNQLGGTQILANYDLTNFVTNNLALCFLSGYSMSYDAYSATIGFNYWIDLSNSNFLEIGGTFLISGSGAQTSLVFDGLSTVGNIAYSGNNYVPIGNSDYTISVWFNPSVIGGTQGLVGWGNYGTTDQCNALRLNNSDLINYWWGDDLGVTAGLTAGTWYNAVCTYVGATNTRSIYLNGSLLGSDNPSGTHAVPDASNLTVGYTGVGSEYFDGKIQNVAIYYSCLGAEQVLQNYQALETIIF